MAINQQPVTLPRFNLTDVDIMRGIYTRAFSDWLKALMALRPHGEIGALSINRISEHADEIAAWRDSLPERQRKRLIHPLSVTRRWRASLTSAEARSPHDLKRDAVAAWWRFVACAKALPPDQARPLWQDVHAHAATALGA